MSRGNLGRRLDVYYERLWRRRTFNLGREFFGRSVRHDAPERFVRFLFRDMLDGFLLLFVFLAINVLILLFLIVNKGTWWDLNIRAYIIKLLRLG